MRKKVNKGTGMMRGDWTERKFLIAVLLGKMLMKMPLKAAE